MDSDNIAHKGETLTEAFKNAEKDGCIYDYEDLVFYEATEVKTEFAVIPVQTVKTVTKKATK